MSFLYKVQFKIVAILFVLISSEALSAENCSFIELKKYSDAEIKLNKINGNLAYRGVKSFNQWRSNNIFKVEAGSYELSGAIISDGSNKAVNNRTDILDYISPIYFGLVVEANKYYEIGVSFKDKEASDVVISQRDVVSCDLADAIALDAFQTPPAYKQITLKNEVALKIQRIFFNQYSGNSNTIQSISPSGFSANLGLTFNQLQTRDAGIEVLSILPFSTASKLDIKSGDILLTLNGKKLVGSFQDKKQYFEYMLMGLSRELSIRLIRGNEKKELEIDIRSLFIPKYQYTVNSNKSSQVKNYVAMNEHLRNELELELTSLSKLYGKQYPNIDEIRFHIPAQPDKTVGITGRQDNQGIVVNFIRKNSVAEQLGIKIGDILIDINEKGESAAGLKNQQAFNSKVFNVKVIRNGNLVEINDIVTPPQLPAVNMSLTLGNGFEFIEKQISNAKIERKIASRFGVQSSRLAQHNNRKSSFSKIQSTGNEPSSPMFRSRASVNNSNTPSIRSSKATLKN